MFCFLYGDAIENFMLWEYLYMKKTVQMRKSGKRLEFTFTHGNKKTAHIINQNSDGKVFKTLLYLNTC